MVESNWRSGALLGGAERELAGAPAGRPDPAPPPPLPGWMDVKGFVDIHCHLLPGLDDGPETWQLAEEMVRRARRAGTLAAIATPHCSIRFPFDAERTSACLRRMEDNLPHGPAVFGGCELQLNDEAVRDFAKTPRAYTLNGTRYVLVELLPQVVAASVGNVLDSFRERGYIPILAHPERYRLLSKHPLWLRTWKNQGCLIQLTASSLTGAMGAAILSAATAMVREGMAHFVASDAHDLVRRPPSLLEGFCATAEIAGVASAGKLFTHNPLALLHDQTVEQIC